MKFSICRCECPKSPGEHTPIRRKQGIREGYIINHNIIPLRDIVNSSLREESCIFTHLRLHAA